MPCCAVHSAVARVPEPHQMRSARPGDCGWIASRPPDPAGHPRVGVDHGRPGERRPEQRGLLTGEVGVARPLRRHVAERLRAAQRRLRRSPAHAELQPAVAEQVGRGGLLGHVQRVLVAHVDDAGADLDAGGPHGHRRQQRERRGQLPGEVVHPHVRAVHPELLGRDRQLHALHERVATGPHLRARDGLPVPEGQEPDPLLHAPGSNRRGAGVPAAVSADRPWHSRPTSGSCRRR